MVKRCTGTFPRTAVRGQRVDKEGRIYLRGREAPKDAKPLVVQVRCVLPEEHEGEHYNGAYAPRPKG